MTPADHHRRVAADFTTRVEGVADWSAPTPVVEWTARDVVDHLVTWFPEFLAVGGIRLDPGPSVVDDPVAAWSHHTAAVQQLLDGPRAEETFVHPHVGEHTVAGAVEQFYTADVFMHTWDLARATGQDDHLDEGFCAVLLTGLEPMDEVLRSSGQFAPAVPVPVGAPVQDRLIGFIGRDPGWSPA